MLFGKSTRSVLGDGNHRRISRTVPINEISFLGRRIKTIADDRRESRTTESDFCEGEEEHSMSKIVRTARNRIKLTTTRVAGRISKYHNTEGRDGENLGGFACITVNRTEGASER